MTDIKSQLLSLGYSEKQVRQAIKDVSEVISKKIFDAFFEKLDQSEKEKVQSMSQDQMIDYIKNQSPLTKKEVDEIADKTWDNYFNNVKI